MNGSGLFLARKLFLTVSVIRKFRFSVRVSVSSVMVTYALTIPKSELRKFSHGPSIILTKYHHQLSSTKVDAWYDQLSTVVGRTKMTILATIDVRPTVLASPSQFIALGVYRCVQHDVRVSASRGSVRDS